MRWPWTKPQRVRQTPDMGCLPPPPPSVPYLASAYIHGVVVTTLARAHGDDEAFAEKLRPVLLDEARKLVEVLQGEVPASSGNILRFERKAK